MGFLLAAMDRSLYSALKPEAHTLANLIKADTADPAKGETFAKWRELVNATDEELWKNDKRMLKLVCARFPGFNQQPDFQSNTAAPFYMSSTSQSYSAPQPSTYLPAATYPAAYPSASLAGRPTAMMPAFPTTNSGFVNAINAQRHHLTQEELFTLAKLAHGCLKCLMPFQSHITRFGQCDSPAITPGMPDYQPCNVAWVNEWMCLNPGGFKN